LIRAIDPTDREPVYLLSAEEAAEYLDFTCNTIGATAPLLCYALQPVLQDFGAWAGYGFAAVIDMEHLPSQLEVDAIVLHELIHHVLATPLMERAGRDRPHLLAAAQAQGAAGPPATPRVVPNDSGRPWAWHGAPFARLAIHIGYRATRISRWAPEPSDIFRGDLYFLSDAIYYADALSDEPARLAELPLRQVATTTPPDSFQRFAARDLQRAEERFQFQLHRQKGHSHDGSLHRTHEPAQCVSRGA
jgi:hypothetical protein